MWGQLAFPESTTFMGDERQSVGHSFILQQVCCGLELAAVEDSRSWRLPGCCGSGVVLMQVASSL